MAAPDDQVVLVDWDDSERGSAPKLEAHRNGGLLHRAVSVLVFDRGGRMLIQRRAPGKYHAANQWANACCSHPRRGESALDAGHRRLREELGFDCDLRELFAFTYACPVGNGLTEREFDHVLVGTYDGQVAPDPAEVSETKWVSLPVLYSTVRLDSRDFAPWFKMILIEVAHSGSIGLPPATPSEADPGPTGRRRPPATGA